jgi:hypothetical protein
VVYPACKDHPDKKIEFYCTNSNCGLVCSSCVAISHNGHKVTDIPSAARVKRDIAIGGVKSLIDQREAKEKWCESAREELRKLFVRVEDLQTNITAYEQEIQALTCDINIIHLVANEPSDVDMLNPAKFTSLVTAINHHYGLSVPLPSASIVVPLPIKSVTLNDKQLTEVDGFIKQQTSSSKKLGPLLAQATPTSTSLEPIKKAIMDKCTNNGKGVVLMFNDGTNQYCFPSSNWNNNIADDLGYVAYSGDVPTLYPDRKYSGLALYLNIPNMLKYRSLILTINQQNASNVGTSNCSALEVFEIV